MIKKIQKIILILSLLFSFFAINFTQAKSVDLSNMTQEQKMILIKTLKQKILEITKKIQVLIEKKYNNSLVYKLTERPQREKIRFPVEINSSYDYIDGDKNAKLILISYTDLECPYCKRAENNVIKKLEAKYKKSDLSFVTRHFPLKTLHPSSCKEAKATVCAGSLGGSDKYYKMINKIFENTKSNGNFDLKKLPKFAEEIGVNKLMFNKCMDDENIKKIVKSSYAEGDYAGVMGTPTLFLMARDGDGVRVSANFESLDKIISDTLKEWENQKNTVNENLDPTKNTPKFD